MKTLLNILRDEKTLVVSNHSGGKDSPAMYLPLKNILPEAATVIPATSNTTSNQTIVSNQPIGPLPILNSFKGLLRVLSHLL